MDALLKRFEHHLALERNLSPRTITSYLNDLKQFHSFVQEQPGFSGPAGNWLSKIDTILLRRFGVRLDYSKRLHRA